MKNYLYIPNFSPSAKQKKKVQSLLATYSLEGTEIPLYTLFPRRNPLFENDVEKNTIVDQLNAYSTKRIHMSYWAEPSDFITKVDFPALISRFGNEREVIAYYGDLSGEKMYARWVQEYEIARLIKAESVTFHVIDYFHIDGTWEFSNSRVEILNAMVGMVQKLLDILIKKNLLVDGPYIELENAGFGLEYGLQRADDYIYFFAHIRDVYNKVRIGWDTNHLLHALGVDKRKKKASFFLPSYEVTPQMDDLEKEYGNNLSLFAEKWISLNILHPNLLDKLGSIHVSDCLLKTEEFFRKGRLTGKYLEHMKTLKSPEEKEEYGLSLVLKYYDSHLPLGSTIKHFSFLLEKLPKISLIHELKNSKLDEKVLLKQLNQITR